MKTYLRGLALLTLSLVLVSGAWAGQTSEPSEKNIRVTIRVGHTEEGELSVRSYQMMVVDGGEPTNLMTGSRFPIPTTTFQTSQPPREVVPMTSYTYQNVGFQAQVRAWLVADGKIKLDASIEMSRVGHDPRTGGQPLIVTRDQEFRTLLTPGVAMEVSRVESSNPGVSFFEIQADLVD